MTTGFHPQSQAGLCRDCLSQQIDLRSRCFRCGSPRLVRDPELFTLSLAHIDCDAFFAAIEKRDHPELRDKPVIIGGGKRGVVATCCYNARIYGVHSAMPMFKALKLCPSAVVIRPDITKYSLVGQQILQRMKDLTPLVEPLSIDEAFLDLTGTEKLHKEPAAVILARLAKRIEDEIGITISVGLSYCKFLAKVASDLEKPRGFSVIGKTNVKEFLAKQPVTTIWGVGKAFARRLASDGLTSIGQLQSIDETTLIKRYGTMGKHLFSLAQGEDHRRVAPNRELKTISTERTFDRDLANHDELVAHLRAFSEKISTKLKTNKLAAQTVVLKLKTHNFKTKIRTRTLNGATQRADKIFHIGRDLLTKQIDGTAYRLLGLGVQQLVPEVVNEPCNFFDLGEAKRERVETAMDKLRARFGTDAIETGYTFGRTGKSRQESGD